MEANSEEIFRNSKVIAVLYAPFLYKTLMYIINTPAIIP